MKTKITHIAILSFLIAFSGVFAQNAEGGNENSSYLSKKSLDVSKTSVNTFQDENLQTANTVQRSNRAAASNHINYQAVARNAGGVLITNTAVTIDFDIHEGTAGGPVIYSETQNPTTDANGVFSVEIGSVVPLTIAWSSDAHFLEVSLNGTSVGTTEFVSVPYAKSADTMPTDARIGDSTVSSADVVTISGDNSIVGEIIDIRATNVVTAANDLMNMDMPAGSSADAQFIEARNGGAVVFQVQGDGRTLINTTTTAPQLNTVYGNSMPIAYGSINVSGGISAGYGIASVTSSGGGVYNIVLTHATEAGNPIVSLTPFTTGIGSPEIMGYQNVSANEFRVNIQTVGGVGTDSAFSFVAYGNH